jgi:putative membrane protein
MGRVKDILNRLIAMKLIAALWFLSYLLGVHIYLVMYY